VVNGGAACGVANALHDESKAITDRPVVLDFNENGQGHAVLGNNYWTEQGIPVVAHVDAAHEVEEYGGAILRNMERYNRDQAEGTLLQGPTETFDEEYIVEMGDFRIEARHLGPGHSPGDILRWLPKQSLVLAVDMAFHERTLPIFEDRIPADCLETWDTAFEPLGATYVIPGHGHPTNMDQVRRYTKDYLVHLRQVVGDHIAAGGGLAEAFYVDQSAYANLDTFEELATKNAGRVFEQMEFE